MIDAKALRKWANRQNMDTLSLWYVEIQPRIRHADDSESVTTKPLDLRGSLGDAMVATAAAMQTLAIEDHRVTADIFATSKEQMAIQVARLSWANGERLQVCEDFPARWEVIGD